MCDMYANFQSFRSDFVSFGIDDRPITHLIGVRLKHLLYDFFRGVVGPPSCCFSYINGPKHPLKKSYSKCLRRTPIR